MVEQKTENPHGVRVLDFGGGEESRTPTPTVTIRVSSTRSAIRVTFCVISL